MGNPAVAIQLRMGNTDGLLDQVARNAAWAMTVAEPGSRAGQRVVICGAGPSLTDHLDRMADADEVWACNSALPYLWDRGVRVTHGVTVDQGAAMLEPEELGRLLPVGYYLASSVHPDLVRRLAVAGHPVTFFHNYLGVADPPGWAHPDPAMRCEEFTYRRLYRPTLMVGVGLNTAIRAASLALGLGFASIEIVGADCAARPDGPPMPDPRSAAFGDWVDGLVLYADGRTASGYGPDGPLLEAVLDGRRWHTRPDMVVTATDFLALQAAYPGRLTFVGDTLVNALVGKDADYLAAMPRLTDDGRVTNLSAPEALVA